MNLPFESAGSRADFLERVASLAGTSDPGHLIQVLESLIYDRFSASLSLFLLPPELASHSSTNLPEDLSRFHQLILWEQAQTVTDFSKTNNYRAGTRLVFEDELLGSLVASRTMPCYDKNDLEDLLLISNLASAALNLGLLKRQQTYQKKQLTLISEVIAQLAHIRSFDTLLVKVCELIHRTFGYYYVAVLTIAPDGHQLLLGANSGTSKDQIPAFEVGEIKSLVVGEHIVGGVAASGEPILANEVKNEPRYFASEALPETEAEIAIPIKLGNTILGVLDVQSDHKNAFSPSDLVVLTSLADGIALAINRVRLFESLEKRTDQLAVVSEVSRSISSVLELDQLLKKVTDLLHEEFNFPYVHIFTIQHATKKIEYRAGSGSRSEAFKQAGVSYSLNAEKGILPTALRTNQIQLVNDVSQETSFIPNPITNSRLGSELAVPLSVADNLMGVLDIQSDEPNFFTQSDIDLITTLASSISIALRNANLYSSERWRRNVAEALRDVAVNLSQNMSLDESIQDIFSKIEEVLPCDIAALWLLDEESELTNHAEQSMRLVWVNAFGKTDSTPEIGLTVPSDNWLFQALQQEEPLIYETGLGFDPFKKSMGFGLDYSAVAAPLSTGGTKLGVLTLHHHTNGRYGLETRNITLSFAGYAAVAIENERLAIRSRDQAWLSTISLQVALATRSLLTIEDLSELIGKLVILLIGGTTGGILLRDTAQSTFFMQSIFDESCDFLRHLLPVRLLRSQLLDEIIADPKPHALPAINFDPNIQTLLNLQPTDTILLFPLVTHNEVLGLLMQVDSDPYVDAAPEQVIGKQKYAIIEGIAQQAAVSLQNINLLNAKQNETYISRVLLHVSQVLGSASSLEEGFSQVTSEIPILSGLESFAIIEKSEDNGSFILRHLNTESQPNHRIKRLIGLGTSIDNLPELEELSTKTFAIKPANWFHTIKAIQPFLPPNEAQDEQPQDSVTEAALIVFPLKLRGINYGYMIARDRHVTNRDLRVELLTGLAQQLSTAIVNNHLKQIQDEQEKTNREFSLARQIQKTFLPESLPDLDGYETSVRWQTALQVGGDFYDLFPMRDHLFGIVIADVSDKGLAAALYMTVSRTLIRAASLETISPAQALERVNHLLQLDSEQGFFVTTFFGVLDLDSNVLTYCNAGHNPPLFYTHATHRVQQLKRGGIALGAFEAIKLPEHQLSLEPGDILYLFTDGVTEGTAYDGDFYGLDRPTMLLEKNGNRSAKEILDVILNDQGKFRGDCPFSDDITQLILKRI